MKQGKKIKSFWKYPEGAILVPMTMKVLFIGLLFNISVWDLTKLTKNYDESEDSMKEYNTTWENKQKRYEKYVKTFLNRIFKNRDLKLTIVGFVFLNVFERF